MKRNIERLYQISQKTNRKILGLMSGTSIDGLDIALCDISGSGTEVKATVLRFDTVPYTDAFKAEIRDVFSKREVDLELVTLLNADIGKRHAQMINKALSEWECHVEEIDLIASHGQTIYHAPLSLHGRSRFGNATLQIGDGDHIAVGTGIITISDFRQKHIANGGEGAPLAIYGDYLLGSHSTENRVLLNIGGISNFTWIPARDTFDSRGPYASDVGPGNTVMDAYMQCSCGQAYDYNGSMAQKGEVNMTLLERLMEHPFFAFGLPKSIGPELFNLGYLDKALQTINQTVKAEDIMATLNMWTAKCIAIALKDHFPPSSHFSLYVSGGGAHNTILMENIKKLMQPTPVNNTNTIGLNPDAKEAVLFAILANECISGNPSEMLKISMGKISFPS